MDGPTPYPALAKWRNRLLITFALTGSTLGSMILFLPTTNHSALYAAAALVIVSSVCMSDSYVFPHFLNGKDNRLMRHGESYVCLNAMLPSLSSSPRPPNPESHPLIIPDLPLEITDLAPAAHPPPGTSAHVISSRGIAIGFAAGVTALTISLIPLSLAHDGSLTGMQRVIGGAGIIWLLLAVRVLGLLPHGNVPEPVSGVGGHGQEEDVRVGEKVMDGWRRVGGLFDGGEVRRLRVTYWYLFASALLQDGESSSSLAGSIILPMFHLFFSLGS